MATYKKLFILIPVTILFVFLCICDVKLAVKGNAYFVAAVCLGAALLIMYKKIWRWTFEVWYLWLNATAAQRREVIKRAIARDIESKVNSTLSPPQASDPKGMQ